MTVATTKKASAKPAAKVASKATKAAPAKAAAKPRTTRKPVAATPTIKFHIEDYARPKAGNLLFAFTAAWLNLTGLTAGKAIARADLVKIAGETAVSYHTKNGNLAKSDAGLTLTEKGTTFFGVRQIDPQLQDAFIAVLTTGKPNDVAHVKSEKAIKAA